MTRSGENILFWCLVVAQTAGSRCLSWTGIPTYRRQRSSLTEGATIYEFMPMLVASTH